MKFLMVGNGGRESMFAKRLAEDVSLYAVLSHKNQGIIDCVNASGGQYIMGNPADPVTVARFAVENSIDYAFVNTDEPLANGVVDALLEQGIKAVGGTQEATRIEWDKIYSIEIMKKICPESTPFFIIIRDKDAIGQAIAQFKSRDFKMVIKPQGLTGGKGVKVMPEHLGTYEDCARYASELLEKNPKHGVLLVEKLDGIEFTIMGITDGKKMILAPASYDYPYREEGDKGAGTGGMGCFTDVGKRLPFMTDGDLADCEGIMQGTINHMRKNGIEFKGVLNGGFFKTKDGIKFMEFNGRFGDPEGINVLSLLEGSFSRIITSLYHGTITEDNIKFARKASVVKYLVAHEYPEKSEKSTIFEVDEKAVAGLGVDMFAASCVKIGDGKYETLKKSRVMAFAATSDRIDEASDLINSAIDRHVCGDLEYRRDIGSRDNLEKLDHMSKNLQT